MDHPEVETPLMIGFAVWACFSVALWAWVWLKEIGVQRAFVMIGTFLLYMAAGAVIAVIMAAMIAAWFAIKYYSLERLSIAVLFVVAALGILVRTVIECALLDRRNPSGHAKEACQDSAPVLSEPAAELWNSEKGDGRFTKSDSRWSIVTAEDDGKPLIFHIRNQAPPFATKEGFPYLLAISWPYQSPNDKAMPSPDEAQRMAQLEDLLEAGLESVQQAFVAVVVTGNSVREWQWYARDTEKTMELVNKTLGHLEPFPIHFNFQDDPDWKGYNGFLFLVTYPSGCLLSAALSSTWRRPRPQLEKTGVKII